MVVALLNYKVTYPGKKKANEFVPRGSLGICVAQDEERYQERIMHSHGVDLTNL